MPVTVPELAQASGTTTKETASSLPFRMCLWPCMILHASQSPMMTSKPSAERVAVFAVNMMLSPLYAYMHCWSLLQVCLRHSSAVDMTAGIRTSGTTTAKTESGLGKCEESRCGEPLWDSDIGMPRAPRSAEWRGSAVHAKCATVGSTFLLSPSKAGLQGER